MVSPKQTFVLALLLVTPGCASIASPTSTGTPSATPTATPVTDLPGPDCLTDSAPRPGVVEGVEPLAYPEPPATVNRSTIGRYVAAVERAYYHNHLLAEEERDDGMNLTDVSAYAEVENVTRRDEYVVRLSVSAATNYADGIHGDHWPSVAYRVNETTLLRGSGENGTPTVADGTLVLDCR